MAMTADALDAPILRQAAPAGDRQPPAIEPLSVLEDERITASLLAGLDGALANAGVS